MAATHGAPQPHVPAWKRLGLQLKFAKDTAEPSAQTQQRQHPDSPSADQAQATKDESGVDNERPAKKRKTTSTDLWSTGKAASLETAPTRPADVGASHDSTARASVENEAAVKTTDSHKPASQGKPEDQQIKTPKRRKSVTFTEGTKATDGNSAQSIIDPTTDSPTSRAPNSDPGASEPEARRPKKSKRSGQEPRGSESPKEAKKKPKKVPQEATKSQEKPEYARYLEQYHQDRSSWKFNKNHQTALLKNAFNLDTVPSSLTPALVEYITGLQGAGPRQRLIENSIAILETFAAKDGSRDEIKAMNTQSARKEAYFRAMAKEVKKWEAAGMPRSEYDDDQMAKVTAEIEGGKRAEAILELLGMGVSFEAASAAASAKETNETRGDSLQTATASTSPPKKTARKRKQRGEVDSDSSSSDSDTDSDSSTSSSDSSSDEKTPTTTIAPHQRPATSSAPPRKSPPPRTPAYQHPDFNMAYRPQNPSQLMNAQAKPTRKFFDDELLDAAFPPKKTKADRETAPKRRKGGDDDDDGRAKKKKARGFAYTHGVKGDEGGSEDE